MNEALMLVLDLEMIVGRQAHQSSDCGLARKGPRNWLLVDLTTVNMSFKNDTNLGTIIELLKVVKEELGKHLQNSWARCEGEIGRPFPKEALDKKHKGNERRQI